MAQITRSISLPEEIMDAIDKVAEGWYTDRSKAIIRIFVEWRECQENKVTLVSTDQKDSREAIAA